jgi:predicted metal-dependent phosphoesterase TrpH
MCTVPFFRSICRECYSEPAAVYEKLKQAGMDLVTVTDHDSIEAGETLARHADFFLSEEVTCLLPTGTTVHIGVYDLKERQHLEIQNRRNDLPRLLAYLREQDLLFGLKHPFSCLTGRRDFADLQWFRYAFPAWEVVNGQIPESNNRLGRRFALREGRAALAGSDAHTLLSAGSAFTVVPGARTCEEFLAGLREGRGRVGGDGGSYWKLTREVLGVSRELLREKPWAWLLAPLTLAVPIVTLANYLRELSFARVWRKTLEKSSPTRGFRTDLERMLPFREMRV